MAHVTLENVVKRYGDQTVLSPIQLTVKDGEFLTLLGPSGCGKSTLLRMIAGLTEVTEGAVYIGDEKMNDVAPKDRGVGMVFQSYALFPNMTVAENVAFGLDMQKVKKDERATRVQEMLALVGLENRASHYPNELSGGQQQRVALARALVVRPRVLLLDEPLSALDAKIRKHLQRTLRDIQRQLKITMILVTHDQEEAMALADRIVLLDSGQIAQIGTPKQLYRQPATEFVARFIGHYNVWTKEQVLHHLEGDASTLAQATMYAMRPEAFRLQEIPDSFVLRGTVVEETMAGNIVRTTLACEGEQFVIEQLHQDAHSYQRGEMLTCWIPYREVIALQ
ncbi:ABC transporter ATP-binding protein [Savagea faecisuis]|uniref:ABC transporter ATP-binding protein n=1 Tax=Savagea faecisuis TaxID=1274803 RepID=A0ABW3H029_9BACL